MNARRKEEVVPVNKEANQVSDSFFVGDSVDGLSIWKPEECLSSGLTILDLMTSNKVGCCIRKGQFTRLIGQSGSGKSMLAMQFLAEASINPNFDNYQLIYDDVEGGAGNFPVRSMFGPRLADRLTLPYNEVEGMPTSSATVEAFYASIDYYQKRHIPFIYVLDSMDNLSSLASDRLFESNKAQLEKDLQDGKMLSEWSTGYGDGKAKSNSQNIRRVKNSLKVDGSILIMISQLRDNITGYGPKYSVSGGKALEYNADTTYMVYNQKKIEKTIRGIQRTIGQVTRVELTKNRFTGLKNEVVFPILTGVGIADMDAVLDWLGSEGEITVPKSRNMSYKWERFELECKRDKMIEWMEQNTDNVRAVASEVWNDIVKGMTTHRHNKYQIEENQDGESDV